MTIKQQGGVFGRNPTFNDVSVENRLTVTGDLNVDSNTFFVESSTNRVGINNNNPTQELEVDGTIRVNLGVNDYAVGVVSSGGGGFFLEPDDYTASNPIWKFRTFANENIGMYRGNSDCGTFTANGLAFPSGKGIDFSATSGTGTSELFDDYEEGTFSPTFVTDGTDFDSVTYDALTSAKYVKIGSMVHVQIMIRTDNITVGSATGSVRVGGLPFTSSNGTQADSSGELTIGQTASWAGDVPFVAEIVNNSTTARLWYRTAVNGSTTAVAIADLGTGADSNLIRLSGSYIAA